MLAQFWVLLDADLTLSNAGQVYAFEPLPRNYDCLSE